MTRRTETVNAVHIYPIKSCQAATVDGIPPTRLDIAETGFAAYDVLDRDYVLIEAEPLDDGSHLFVSQRGWGANGRLNKQQKNDRLLATVKTDITEKSLTIRSAAGELVLATDPDWINGEIYTAKIHNDYLRDAVDQGSDAADHFSELLGRAVRLVRMGMLTRYVEEQGTDPITSSQVAAADGYPFLLVSKASLLQGHIDNGLAPNTVPIDRYRGNIEINGDRIGPWGEDTLSVVTINNTLFNIVKACSRCPIPNIDQATGERTGGGLPVLRGHAGIRPGDSEAKPLFGQNMNHEFEPGRTIGAGDIMQIMWRNDRPNFSTI